jgi:sulfur carrier protein ThiS
VIGRHDGEAHDVITPAIFDTGTPTLLMPSEQRNMGHEWRDNTVAVAWNGSLQAARALHNALPFIGNAKELYVLTAQESGRHLDLEAECGVMEYLHMQGLHARGIIVATGQRTVPEALLARAKDLHADLLVIGAYGHSMLREMLLGGVTEHILNNADIPLLLSH